MPSNDRIDIRPSDGWIHNDSPVRVTKRDGRWCSRLDTGEQIGPSMTVLWTVGAALDRDPLELDVLWNAVDPDALDALLTHWRLSDCDGGRVSFPFAGCQVTVHADGRVEVTR